MNKKNLKEEFEKKMLDWGYLYYDWAGMKMVYLSDDSEIIEGDALINGGDWVVHDIRGNSGTYGVSHEDFSIQKVKIKNGKKHGVDYKQKTLDLKVDAVELMERFQWFASLFMSRGHQKRAVYNESLFKDGDDVTQKYENEKSSFSEDPHLALYWLLHFGFTLDNRYEEVKELISKFDYTKDKQYYFDLTTAFFESTDAFYNVKIGDSDDLKDLFLIRRAFLIYWVQSYRNYNLKNLDLWWKSVSIYPYVEEDLIIRMRWLKNNLKKTNAWDSFEELIQNESKNTPLLSYIFACNPNTSGKDKTKYADQLLGELYEHRDHWKSPNIKKFGEILIWDIREFSSDKKLLAEVSKFYFQGNETSQEYQDIQAVLGIENKNIDEIRKHLEELNALFEGYDRFDTPEDKRQVYHQKVTAYLDNLTPEILKDVVVNIKNHELAKRCFVYLWLSDIQDKKEALIKLFIYIEFSAHDINERLFGEHFPQLIIDENDSNLAIAKAFFTIPKADFRNDYAWEKSKEAATMFFLKIAHLPSVFDYLIKMIQQAPNKENEKVLDAIYTNLFSEEYESKINPTLQFSKEQIETMLETICQWFLDYGYHEAAYHSIYDCTSPLAEAWIRNKQSDKKWLKKFAGISSYDDPLNEELKDAFESALESIEDYKHESYLEYKDEKSHIFWQIMYYDGTYITTHGKVGTEGKSTEKSFDSRKESYKAGDKLVKSKLKEGFKKVNIL